jgi:hypothetical protein
VLDVAPWLLSPHTWCSMSLRDFSMHAASVVWQRASLARVL